MALSIADTICIENSCAFKCLQNNSSFSSLLYNLGSTRTQSAHALQQTWALTIAQLLLLCENTINQCFSFNDSFVAHFTEQRFRDVYPPLLTLFSHTFDVNPYTIILLRGILANPHTNVNEAAADGWTAFETCLVGSKKNKFYGHALQLLREDPRLDLTRHNAFGFSALFKACYTPAMRAILFTLCPPTLGLSLNGTGFYTPLLYVYLDVRAQARLVFLYLCLQLGPQTKDERRISLPAESILYIFSFLRISSPLHESDRFFCALE